MSVVILAVALVVGAHWCFFSVHITVCGPSATSQYNSRSLTEKSESYFTYTTFKVIRSLYKWRKHSRKCTLMSLQSGAFLSNHPNFVARRKLGPKSCLLYITQSPTQDVTLLLFCCTNNQSNCIHTAHFIYWLQREVDWKKKKKIKQGVRKERRAAMYRCLKMVHILLHPMCNPATGRHKDAMQGNCFFFSAHAVSQISVMGTQQ